MDMDTFINREIAIIYAYRYLLDREPESFQLVTCNERSWQKLRIDIMNSLEYKRGGGGGGGTFIRGKNSLPIKSAQPEHRQIMSKFWSSPIPS